MFVGWYYSGFALYFPAIAYACEKISIPPAEFPRESSCGNKTLTFNFTLEGNVQGSNHLCGECFAAWYFTD